MENKFRLLAGRKILILDDSDQITSLLQDIFTSCGADVTTANTGQAAMVGIELGRYDLVVLDLVLPQLDGWDVISFMRMIRPGLLARTILITGDFYRAETIRRIRNIGLPVLYKPFDVDKLRSLACELLSLAGVLPAA